MLKLTIVLSREDAQWKIESEGECNRFRPHSSIGILMPNEILMWGRQITDPIFLSLKGRRSVIPSKDVLFSQCSVRFIMALIIHLNQRKCGNTAAMIFSKLSR